MGYTSAAPTDPEAQYHQNIAALERRIADLERVSGRTRPGWIAQTFVTTDQLAIGAGPSNLSNFDLAFTAVAGRRYKFTISLILVASAASTWGIDLLDGAANLGRIAEYSTAVFNDYQRLTGIMITNAALSAGSRTLHASITRFVGTGTADCLNSVNSFLLVEDIGAF